MSTSQTYDHKSTETKWSEAWRENRVYEPNLDNPKNQFYNLMMFPYPSAEGLHVGNMYAFSGADIYGRYQRMLGKDVLEPIGLDGFGIHSENYALKIGAHPIDQAKKSQANFYRQLSLIGNGFAWEERLETYDPEYYRWTQWLFIQMFKKGLAYKGSSKVNWCPSCKTVLADEQVEDGKCERCKSEVERREANQWFFKITDYADRLLKNIEGLKWPDGIRSSQRRWIGKKQGMNITFEVVDSKETLTCFTTTPVNYGATFLVIAPEHPFVQKIINKSLSVDQKTYKEVSSYVKKASNKSELQRQVEGKEKTGAFTGFYVRNHVDGKNIPVWISDFVLMDFGTGAVQGCPGHDMRDFEFATKFNIPIKRVVVGPDGDMSPIDTKEKVIQAGDPGTMVNSEFLNGLEYKEAMQVTMDHFEKKSWGKRVYSYHLRDWLISRQRYWGPPIPMIECPDHGWVPVPEDQLPVELPYVKEYQPTGDGKSPLEKAGEDWLYTKCPQCGKKSKRETDVSDTFLDSSWYFLRYPSLHASTKDTAPFDPKITKAWMPVDAYIGGAEHAVLHLLYSRFVTMALKDWGHLDFEEPFPFLFGHGLIIKDGAKMSKSKGNVVNPDEYIEKFGADTLRTYLMFLGPYDQGGDFRDTGIAGMYRWMMKVWRLFNEGKKIGAETTQASDLKLHQTIEKATREMAAFKFNTSIAALMELANTWSAEGEAMSKEDALKFLQMLAPFAPFMTEDIYQSNYAKSTKGKFESIHKTLWPVFNAETTKQHSTEVVVQVNGKFKTKLTFDMQASKDEAKVTELALKDARVKKAVGKAPMKVIFVPGRLMNFVV